MTDYSFDSPTLHLVIVDDDVEDFQPLLRNSFEEQMKRWGVFRTCQFKYKIHLCQSKQGFEKTVSGLLLDGQIVYATVDLFLPIKDGPNQAPNKRIWKDVIRWCLEQASESSPGRFDFCVISGEDMVIRELFSEMVLGEELERQGVKKVLKTEIANLKDVKLREIWDDVRRFIRSEMPFCTIPEGKTEKQTILWFGDDPSLSELRYLADCISSQSGGLFLLFSDPSCYERDWFRLLCHLRGETTDWRILSLASVNPEESPDWNNVFFCPPKCLFVSHIDLAEDKEIDLRQELTESKCIENLERQGRLVFLQFPFFELEQAVDLKLDPKEQEVLDLCLEAIGAEKSLNKGSGLAYSKNPRIICFPPYSRLKAAQVVNATINFEVEQCRRAQNWPGVILDTELTAVLAEIEWHKRVHGLQELRKIVRRLFLKAKQQGPKPQVVTIDHLPSTDDDLSADFIRKRFRSPNGFSIRGRRLFDLLDHQRPVLPMVKGGTLTEVQLRELDEAHKLFWSLDRLVALRQRLELQGLPTQSREFPAESFRALQRAHEFLSLILESPPAFKKRIEAFRRRVKEVSLSERAMYAYPSLRERENWRELVQQIEFVWPYDMFRLPRSISEYLRFSGVIAEFHADFEAVLKRHPAIAEQWHELEMKREELKEELQSKENQRWAAIRYVREVQSQPVNVILAEQQDENAEASVRSSYASSKAFDLALRSLVYFNCYLAAAENHYRFKGTIVKLKTVLDFLRSSELGPSIGFLATYRRNLSDRLGDSILSLWRDDWPSRGQQDAIRVAKHVAEWLLGTKTVREKDEANLSRIRDLDPSNEICPVDDLLDLFRQVRNRIHKFHNKTLWEQGDEEVWDLMRRFVAATTNQTLRLGFAPQQDDESDSQLVLWTGYHSHRALKLPPGRLSALIGPTHKPLFPIDEFVRIRPGDWSVWGANSPGEDWLNLTSAANGGSVLKPDSDNPWLPTVKQFKSFSIWQES